MSTTLLQRFFGAILLLALLVLGSTPAQATHLLGGEMSYRYLNATGPAATPFRYEVTVTLYSNGLYPSTTGIAAPPGNVTVDLYNRTSGVRITSVSIPRTSPSTTGPLPPPTAPHVPAGCTVQGPNQPFYLCKYTQIINLPVSFDGYYAVFTQGARNNTLTNVNNLQNGPNNGNVPLTLYVSMAPPLIFNRSPVFSDTAVAIVCQNDTTITLNNAVDPDGDRLVYSFGTPYGNTSGNTFPPLPQSVPYFAGYSGAAPFGTGAGNFALINATTGIAKYGAMTNGLYSVAVDVSEYRTINGNEVLLGTTRRDLQLVVSTCPPTPAPVLPPTVSTPRNYTIEEGQSLSIPLTATQASANHPLVLTVNSVLLDGNGPFNTTFNGSTGTVVAGNLTGTATATGNSTVSGTFVYNSACGNARTTPYDLGVTVQDNGCGGRLTADLFRITVTRAAAPTAINGPATVCDPTTVRTYTAAGPVPASYRWRVVGGTINSGQNTNSVNVTWASVNSTGRLILKGISSYGCPTDSVFKSVDIRPLPALTVAATAASICQGASTTLSVTGMAGLTYTWSGGSQTSTNSTFTVTPTATTTYTVVGSDGTCTVSATVTVTVTPPPTADAGADRSVCSGVATTPLGAAAVAGATYSWSPAAGLSSTTVAQPTATLVNTTGTPTTQVYTLTVTSGASCSSVGTVRVTVNPAAVADAGPALTACSGIASVALGTPALTGYTYNWSPAAGLSSTTAAQPTATLANTTSSATTATYTVTATNSTGCSATSTVTLTVSPAAVATPGPAISFCSGTVSAPLGGTATAGTTYSWSPASGLSNPNILNPTVTGTNTTGAPITTIYTLTATTANGCSATATVNATINPAAVADAGPAQQTCSNVGIVIGAGLPVTGTVYAWTPTTGLSSAAVLNPTLTLPNLGTTNITQVYTLTATTANGCTATSAVTVTVFPAAVAQAGPALVFCSGETRTLGSGTPVAGTIYAWSPTAGLSDPTVLSPAITLTNTTGAPIATPYTLTATTANGCTAASTALVTVNQAAVANAGPAQQTCSNVAVVLGSGTPITGTTYAWTPTSGLSSAVVLAPTFTLPNLTGAPIVTTYTLTATTPQGCAATSTVAVTLFPAAVAQAGPALVFCSGETRTLGSGSPVAGTTYAWSPAAGLSDPTVLSPAITLTNTGTAPVMTTYTLTATTANGCSATSATSVTVNQAAVADAGPAKQTCSNVTIVLGSGTPVTGTTYAWTPTTGLSSAAVLAPTFTLPNLGTTNITQVYTLTATTAQGCTATSAATVTVFPAAVAQAGPALVFCSGETRSLGSGTPVVGTIYAWSPTAGLSDPTVLSPAITLTNTTGAPITATYTLTATTANGCTAASTALVTVNQAAVANAGPARQTCSNVAIVLGSGTPVPGTTYAWTPTTGLSSAAVLAPTFTLPNLTGAPIVTTYTLTATTPQGCTATSTVAVTLFPAAVAQAGPALVFCSGETRTLGSGTPVAGTIYAWSPTAGLSDPTVLSPAITLTNTTGAPIATPYTLTATTANGCTASSTALVTVNQAAVANAGPAKQTCSNVAVVLGSGTPVTGTVYAWLPTAGLSSAAVLIPTFTLPNLTGAPIVTTYTLTATTPQGCTATSTVTVTVNPAAVANAGIDKQTCSNVGVVIGTGTAVTGTVYAWTPATGLSSTAVPTPTVTLPNLGGIPLTQQYILLATTANGCFQRDTVIVTINPAAVAVAGASRAVCSGSPTVLGAAPVTGTAYSWSPTTGLSSATVANPTFTLANSTTTPNPIAFTLTATTANGCVATSTVTITVNPAAVADAGPDAALCDLKRVTVGTPARAGYTYSWSPATGLSSTTTAQPVFTAVNATAAPLVLTYIVTATTAQGCVSTDDVVITVNPRPAPEAITGPASVCPTVTGIGYSVATPAGTTYNWMINGGTIASGQGTSAITVNWGVARAGGYIKVFRFNAQGCSSDTTTLPIIINQRLQTAQPSGPGDILAVAPLARFVCQADGPYVYRSGAYAAGSSYSWSIARGTQVSTILNTVTVNWAPVLVPTIGTVVVTETSNPSGGICRGLSDTLYVLINPSPRTTLAITSPVRVCQTNGPVTFALPGGFTGSTYVFRLNGAVVAGTGSTRILSPLPAPGTYPLTAQETTVAGCMGPLYTTTFTVNPTPGAPTLSGSGYVCNTATPQQYAVTNPTAGASYQWTIVGGAVTSGGTSPQVTVTFGTTAPYTVSVAEISASPASCTGPVTTRTIVFDNPSITLANASVDATSNSRIILTLSAPSSGSTPNPVQILRRVAGSGTFVSVGTVAAAATTYTDNSAVDAAANSYEYQLNLTNGCGTVVPSSTAQTVRLVATAAPGISGRDQGNTTLTWNAYVGFAVAEYRIYRRTDAGTPVLVRTVSAATLQATVPNGDPNSAIGAGFDQNFRVVAASAGASPLLSNSNEANVKFANDTKTYNIITPNRDGQNDVLVIDNITLYPGNTFTVFNRWGREVYKTTNYQNNWGGDDNTAAGNYFYLLTLPNGTSVRNWFEIVK